MAVKTAPYRCRFLFAAGQNKKYNSKAEFILIYKDDFLDIIDWSYE